MAQPVICEYFVQNDDYDSNPKVNPYPNVFILPKKYNSVSDVRVKEVIENFPLFIQDKQHSYLLRFETVLQISANKKMTVWVDLNSSNDVCVPHNKGKIRIKALKFPKSVVLKQIPQQQQQQQQQNYAQEPISKPVPKQKVEKQKPAPQQVPQRQQQQQPVPGTGDLFGNIDDIFTQDSVKSFGFQQSEQQLPDYKKSSMQQEQHSNTNTHQQNITDLFGDGDDIGSGNQPSNDSANAWYKQQDYVTEDQNYQQFNSSDHIPTVPQSKDFNIFGDDDITVNSEPIPQSQSQNNIFGGLSDINWAHQPQPVPTTEPEQNNQQAKLPAKKQTNAEVVQEMYQQEALDRDNREKAHMKYEERISNWIGRGPMKNHVKVLLCTLQDILWKDNGWQRVGMDKVQDPQEVKKAYRKATLLCHPDRIQASDDPEKVYIANRCFAAITEAYNLFKVIFNAFANKLIYRKKQGYNDWNGKSSTQ